ncbi:MULTISPECIES: hypothetical protein [unclassified Anaerobiospirillum]|nr:MULTISPECIES: hypothetical protein [unclassified Anaerobiospirillum]MCK0535074.1 hypothetical protein [Anaerobiospirillum sp. NML120511]MCK0540198.1 hypothetical protein [Anaerobiospirillum sp. NML02-A-032]
MITFKAMMPVQAMMADNAMMTARPMMADNAMMTFQGNDGWQRHYDVPGQ